MVVELIPPAVQTELHDAKHQPTLVNGRRIGMPIVEFIEEAWPAIVEEKEEIPIGFARTAFEKVDQPRKEIMKHMPWDPSEFD